MCRNTSLLKSDGISNNALEKCWRCLERDSSTAVIPRTEKWGLFIKHNWYKYKGLVMEKYLAATETGRWVPLLMQEDVLFCLRNVINDRSAAEDGLE